MVYEMHMHTPLCKHALGEPEEYAQVAWEKGLTGMVVTCHCPLPNGISSSVRMLESQFQDYIDKVQRAQETWAGRIDIRLGMESDYLTGTESYVAKLHERAEFHHILGSVHPHIPEYLKKYHQGSWHEFHLSYFENLALAAETGLFDTLAHPDIVKNLGCAEWDLAALKPTILKALDRIAQTGIAMELNTSGLNKIVPEMNPGKEILHAMFERGIPVVVGADAHSPERVGDRFLEAYNILEEVGYTELSYFLNRKRETIALALARESLSTAALISS